jgi:hypothetical protein
MLLSATNSAPSELPVFAPKQKPESFAEGASFAQGRR